MMRNPGAIVVAMISLGLGIGATTAIFSVVYGALIDPFPYKDVHGIWVPHLDNPNGRGARYVFSRRELASFKEEPAVEDAIAVTFNDAVLGTDSSPETVRVVSMSPNAFPFLGVAPLYGRAVGLQDVGPGGRPERVVVLSYARWRKMFAADPRAVGRTIRLDDELYTIIGVMPPRFTWFGRDSMWAPLDMDIGSKVMTMVRLRLKPGVPQAVAAGQLQSLFGQLAQQSPKDYPKAGFRAVLTNFMDQTVATWQLKKMLYILLGAVSFLLLIGCANVANLLLARATARQKEIAVRTALGAKRRQIAQQLLTESLLLAGAGGALGVLLAFVTLKSIVALIPDIYIPNEAVISVNAWVLLFSILMSTATGILFGLAPAFHATRPDLNDVLKGSAKGSSTGGRGGGTRNVLVVAEVAFSTILLVGASLTMRTFLALTSVSLGYDPQDLLLLNMAAPQKRISNPQQTTAAFEAILQRVRALPGIRAATAGNGGLPFGGTNSAYSIPGKADEPDRRVMVAFVGDRYLDVMRTPLLRGRQFSPSDFAAPNVAMINQTAARQLWGAQDPIGQEMTLELLKSPPPGLRMVPRTPAITVVGLIGDSNNNGLQQSPEPALFLPYSMIAPTRRMIAVRTEGDPLRQANAVREAIAAVDRVVAVSRVDTGEGLMDSQVMGPRFTMVLFLVFAGLGVTLAAVGIYSVLSYSVTRRTNEIGIRMALGAHRGDVIGLIMRSGLLLALVGIGIGLAASAFLSHLLESQIFGVKRLDPMSFAGVTAVVTVVAVIACCFPAARATRLDPASSLRHD
jgi:putative ABC transport system permease protein